jgi:hypothetical protein
MMLINEGDSAKLKLWCGPACALPCGLACLIMGGVVLMGFMAIGLAVAVTVSL